MLGAIGDALVEPGCHREGFATFDELGQVKPGLPAYARVSYARELLGDHSGAVAAMRVGRRDRRSRHGGGSLVGAHSASFSIWEATTRARSGSTASRSPTSRVTQPLSTASH